MTAREVYGKQEALRAAEDVLRGMATAEFEAQRGGAVVSSGDYMRSPEGRAAQKLREEVQAAQAEVGGVVYRVPSMNMGPLREKLDKLVKKARKLEVGSVVYRVDDEVEEHVSTIDPMIAMVELGYIPPRVSRFRFVVLNAAPVKLEGWMFLATLTVEPGGVMISKVPAFARAWSLHNEGVTTEAPHTEHDAVTDAAQEALDAMNLGLYADEKRATLCEHCGLARRRTKTYLVEHAETGEIKQVGSNCLRDFLGVDPHMILRYATYLREIDEGMGDEDGFSGGGGGAKRMIGTEEYVTHVCTMIRTVGWIAASEDYKGRPTRDQAMSNITEYGKVEKGVPQFEEVTEADHKRALAAIEWALDHLGAKVHQAQNANDFERNMYVAANGETIPSKGLGILAYLPVAHARFQEREIERAAKTQPDTDNPSEHVGAEGDRLELTLTVTNIFETAGDYGTSWLTILRDENNNAFKWYASQELERGETYIAKFTVKGHEEYKGIKQTKITRPAGLRLASAPPPPPKPTKLGQRAEAIFNDEKIGEIEKIKGGFRGFIGDEAVVEERTYRQTEDALYNEHLDRQRDAERRAYLANGLPEGMATKMGSHNPYATYRAYTTSRYVTQGEQVAIVARTNGDASYLGSESDYRPARPPKDNERTSEFVWAEVQVTPAESGGTHASAIDPDGHKVPLGEMEVIVRA